MLFGYGPSQDAKLAIIADGVSLRSLVAQVTADPRAPALTLRCNRHSPDVSKLACGDD
jgi:hypothetical protein